MQVSIPASLSYLKPIDELEHVTATALARQSTSLLQRIQETDQAMVVRIHGRDAFVSLSKTQYEEMVSLIERLRADVSPNPLDEALTARFDELVSRMNRPGAREATARALFTDARTLGAAHRPGTTENNSDTSVSDL